MMHYDRDEPIAAACLQCFALNDTTIAIDEIVGVHDQHPRGDVGRFEARADNAHPAAGNAGHVALDRAGLEPRVGSLLRKGGRQARVRDARRNEQQGENEREATVRWQGCF